MVADRGKEEGRIYKNRGLVYRILDADGNKVGVPIKASSIGCKPILENLEKKFATNETAKEPLKQRTKNAIDDCLLKAPGSIRQLVTDLAQKEIYTVLRQNVEGRLYGITFVDNQNKCVFNGSDLGKGYSAAAMQSRLASTAPNKSQTLLNNVKETTGSSSGSLHKNIAPIRTQEKELTIPVKNESLLDVLLSTKVIPYNLPSTFCRSTV